MQSISFDEKQFEQRMKRQKFLTWLMACCPHALTPSPCLDECVRTSQDMRRSLCSCLVSELNNYCWTTELNVIGILLWKKICYLRSSLTETARPQVRNNGQIIQIMIMKLVFCPPSLYHMVYGFCGGNDSLMELSERGKA